MPAKFITFAFGAGVLSESLIGRSDIEKADLGVKKGTNCFIDYRGGISSRQGTEFGDYVQGNPDSVRLIPFRFNSGLGNSFAILAAPGRFRFIQENAYVLETAVGVDSINSTTNRVVTDAAHGYTTGDFVKFQATTDTGWLSFCFEITVIDTTTFDLLSPNGEAIDLTAYESEVSPSTATVSRVYTVANSYSNKQILESVFSQFRDEIYITNEDVPVQRLIRNNVTDWTFEEVNFDNRFDTPTTLVVDAPIGMAGVVYAVTAVNSEGQESIPRYSLQTTVLNITTTEGQVEITWDAVPGASYYRVYRSLYNPTGTATTTAADLGYIGQTIAPQFIDANIIPDFTQSPPLFSNPFAAGGIVGLEVTAGGTGYAQGNLDMSFTGGGGSGADARAIVDDSGAIIGTILFASGSGYTSNPTVTAPGGTGATFSITRSPNASVFPRATARFQQRRYYAGTTQQPMTLFASKPGLYDDFFISFTQTAASPIQLEIDAEETDPIRHLLPLGNGLFVLTASSIWRVRGADDAGLSPLSAIAEPITYSGTTTLAPLRIEQGFLYLQGKGANVKSIRQARGLEQADLSIYSNDFFDSEFPIISWDYAEDPFKLVWAQRSDGKMLSMAYIPEQNVYAWTIHETAGDFLAVGVVEENLKDRVYVCVERTVNDIDYTFFERFAERKTDSVEDMWALDSAISNTLTNPAANCRPGTGTGFNQLVTLSTAAFAPEDVGKHLRVKGGRALVRTYDTPTRVFVDWEIPATEFKNGSTTEFDSARPGEWSLDAKSTTYSGLDHLSGETVSVFADGDYEGDFLVTDGEITLNNPRSKIVAGLSYTAEVETLPLFSRQGIVQDEFKNIQAVTLRLTKSRGLSVGTDQAFYEMREKTFEPYNAPSAFLEGYNQISIGAGWTREGTFKAKNFAPTFFTVLGYVLDVDIADDN